MAWFKVDDTMHSHPKHRSASLAAVGLWSFSGAYCMAYKTDGFVPEWFVSGHPGGKRLAAELVSVGLWDNATHDGTVGYRFHDWLDYQASAEEIEADRERARQRQREYRKNLRNRRPKDGE